MLCLLRRATLSQKKRLTSPSQTVSKPLPHPPRQKCSAMRKLRKKDENPRQPDLRGKHSSGNLARYQNSLQRSPPSCRNAGPLEPCQLFDPAQRPIGHNRLCFPARRQGPHVTSVTTRGIAKPLMAIVVRRILGHILNLHCQPPPSGASSPPKTARFQEQSTRWSDRHRDDPSGTIHRASQTKRQIPCSHSESSS